MARNKIKRSGIKRISSYIFFSQKVATNGMHLISLIVTPL